MQRCVPYSAYIERTFPLWLVENKAIYKRKKNLNILSTNRRVTIVRELFNGNSRTLKKVLQMWHRLLGKKWRHPMSLGDDFAQWDYQYTCERPVRQNTHRAKRANQVRHTGRIWIDTRGIVLVKACHLVYACCKRRRQQARIRMQEKGQTFGAVSLVSQRIRQRSHCIEKHRLRNQFC